MSLKQESDRLTYLLEDTRVEAVNLDSTGHMTIAFKQEFLLLVGIDHAGELDCSILEGPDCDPEWSNKAWSDEGPPMPKRRNTTD